MFDGFESRYFITSDKEKIHYILNFNPSIPPRKTTLIFNYGLVCNFEHWRPQLEYFHKERYPILAYDYRGHFNSTGKESIEKLNLEQFSHDLNELIKFLQLKNPVLLGHSMGVNVCVKFAVMYPKIPSKLILISGTVFDVSNVLLNNEFNKIIIPALEWFFKKYPKGFTNFWNYISNNPISRQIIRHMGFNSKQVPSEFVKYYLKKVGELGPEIFLKLIKEMANTDLLPYLPSISQKTLVVIGMSDKVIPPPYQELLYQQIKNSKTLKIPSGSHVPQIDFPELVNKNIEKFI